VHYLKALFGYLTCLAFFLFPISSRAQVSFVKPLISKAINEKQRTSLKNSVHPLARTEFDRGAAPPDLQLNRMLLILTRSAEQEAALTKHLDEQQDTSSANFHKWLTPEEFGKKFGPSDEDIQTINTWLQSHGLQITQVTKGRTVIEFSGTVAQVQETFHTSIHKFVVNGEQHWANSSDLQIPTALTPAVAGPWSLHNFFKKPQSRFSKETVSANYHPQSVPNVTAGDGSHLLGPGDYAVIYNINNVYNAGINGSGAKIAVVARTEIDFTDVSDFYSIFSIPYNFTTIINNGPSPGFLDEGEQVEAVLDITWAGALATGAQRTLVISASTDTTDGVDLSELYIVENNLADVMTESFSTCEGFHTQGEALGAASVAEQAAAQGITYIVSSGDSGASQCDHPSQTMATHGLSVNMLAATPFTVAVGGTMFNENGQNATYWNSTNNANFVSAKSYIPEKVWNESCSSSQCGQKANLSATGGGVSTFFSKPSWQSGVTGIPSDGKRDIPDISLSAASHDGYLLCFQRSCEPDSQNLIHFFNISGTSASAPSFAAIMALVNQKTGTRQGQANYVLYRLAAAQNYSQCNGSSTTSLPSASCTFRDITSGNNAVPGQTSQQYQSTVGYDLATGLGSPNVANLINNWGALAFTGTTTTLTLNPTTSVTHGSSVNVNVGVSPSSGTGTPAGDVSLVTSNGLGVQTFTLSAGSVSTTTNDLPGGVYNVTAHYAGNGTFGASDSAVVPMTVTPEPSKTTLTLLTGDSQGNPTPYTGGVYGNFVYLRSDVAGQSGNGIPTGVVYFQDSLSTISSGPTSLNSQGNTNFNNGIFWLPAGQHSFTAFYTGDSSFNQSTSTAHTFTITKAPTTITVQTDKTNVGEGSAVTLTANLATNSFSTTPIGGTVTFFSGSTSLGSSGLFFSTDNTTGKALGSTGNFPVSTLATGQNSITAVYNGDLNYLGSTSNAVNVTVAPDFTLGSSSSSGTVKAGQSATSTLTVAGGTGFTGTVTFTCGNLPSKSSCNFNPATLPGTGTTTVTVSTTAQTVAMSVPHIRPTYLASWMFGGAPLIGLFVIGGVSRRRRNLCLGIFLFGVLATCFGCGGGSGGGGGGGGGPIPGTPAGTYQITITATSNGLSHQSIFTLTVQQ
jgi:hypothetical protein